MQSRGFSRLAITLRNQPLWKVLGDARISEGKRPLHLNRLASGLHFCLFQRWEGNTFGSKQRSKVHRSQGRSGWSPGQWQRGDQLSGLNKQWNPAILRRVRSLWRRRKQHQRQSVRVEAQVAPVADPTQPSPPVMEVFFYLDPEPEPVDRAC